MIARLRELLDSPALSSIPWRWQRDELVGAALPILIRVAEAAKGVIDEADPRLYGDLTEKQAALKQCLAALEGGTHD